MQLVPSYALALVALCGCAGEPSDPIAEANAYSEERDRMPRDGDEALAWLLEGNDRFASDQPVQFHEGARRRAMLSEGQHPYAVVLGCADSRVPPELVFDAGLGDLFVIRVAGNVVAEDEAGSIEYAIEHLQVPLVLVLGHEGCGAVTAALGSREGEAEELSRLLAQIRPALDGIDPALSTEERVHRGVEANVRQSVEQLLDIAVREGNRGEPAPGLRIVGGVYELDTGRVRLLE